MPVEVTLLDGEPIIHCVVTGDVVADDIAAMFAQCAAIADTLPGRVYRLTEVRDPRVDFFEVMLILRNMAATDAPGAPTDPRFYGVLVGSDEMTRLIADGSQQTQFGSLNFPLFDSVEAGFAHLRARILEDGGD